MLRTLLILRCTFVRSAVVESQAVSQTRCLRLSRAARAPKQLRDFLSPLQAEQSSSIACVIQSVQTGLQTWAPRGAARLASVRMCQSSRHSTFRHCRASCGSLQSRLPFCMRCQVRHCPVTFSAVKEAPSLAGRLSDLKPFIVALPVPQACSHLQEPQ